jgi:hypothetical protein
MKFSSHAKPFRFNHAVIALICLLLGACEPAQEAGAGPANAVIPPKTFASPEEAAGELIAAAAAYDADKLKQILGSEGAKLVSTGTPAEDRNITATFAEVAQEKNAVVIDPNDENHAVLSIGNDDWPFAIPLVRENGAWFFDALRGQEELLYRRIGANELDTIEVCRGYVIAQQDYASEKHDGAAVNQYAQKIISTEGKRDGLAWKNADGSWGGPVGENAAQAIADGYTSNDPWHGYYYKILTRQGPAAPLGEMDYVIKGAMIGGFALAAAPAQYGATGVMTFIVSNDGVVYEKDLGPDSLETFKTMEVFDPDESWSPVPVEAE